MSPFLFNRLSDETRRRLLGPLEYHNKIAEAMGCRSLMAAAIIPPAKLCHYSTNTAQVCRDATIREALERNP